MSRAAILLSVLVVSAVMAPAAAGGAAAQDGEAYAGAHVSFEVESNAVVDYAVGGEVLFDEVRAESESVAQAGAGAGADADVASNVAGASLELAARSETSATVSAEGTSEIRAHDNERGHLVVDAGDEDAGVAVEVSSEATASEEGDRVVVESDGSTGSFIVVGDGNVEVDGEGNVVAQLDDGDTLVYRSNGEERDEDDREQESLIENGDAVAELYVMERDGERVADTVEYASDVTVDVENEAEGTLDVAVERTTDEGAVVITEVSETVIESAEDVEVTVDGEAAAQVDSYSELESAVGDEHAFMVTEATGAEASGAVLVAVEGFSERTVEMRSGDGSGDAGGDGDTDTEVPGFGVTTALAALLGAGLLALRRR